MQKPPWSQEQRDLAPEFEQREGQESSPKEVELRGPQGEWEWPGREGREGLHPR